MHKEVEDYIKLQRKLFNFKYSWTDLPLKIRDTFHI